MEGVALYRGEQDELNGFSSRFSNVFSTWWAIRPRQRKLAWFTASYGQAATIVPFIAAAQRFFSGALSLGGLDANGGAFGDAASARWFDTAYVAFAGWKAAVDRLTTFTTLSAAHSRTSIRRLASRLRMDR